MYMHMMEYAFVSFQISKRKINHKSLLNYGKLIFYVLKSHNTKKLEEKREIFEI